MASFFPFERFNADLGSLLKSTSMASILKQFIFSNSPAKLVYLQELIVPYKEKRVSKREKVSLAAIARLQCFDEMGDFS